MAKENEKKRSVARELYVTRGYTAKRVAELLEVSAVTIGRWAGKYGWEQQRQAAAMAPGERQANIEQIISLLAKDRLSLLGEVSAEEQKDKPDIEHLKELRSRINKVDAAVAYWNNCRKSAQKEDKISLEVYLKVMEDIFNSMRMYSLELYMKTLDFQEHHINEISIK